MTDMPEKESVYTALGRAIRLNHVAGVEMLLCRVEGDPEKSAVLKWTALMLAASSGKMQIARWLIAEGAVVNKKTKHGHAPLLLAAGKGHTEMVRLLLNAGADVNAVNDNGATALIIAAGAGDEKMLHLLLERSARADIRDAQGFNAESFAEYNGRPEVAEQLRELRIQQSHKSALQKHERLKDLARKAPIKRGPQP